ncbi:ABC transporter ATP-binding protein [Oceaniglobus trochenteri]|uniref:ABC transporter ATP-binding protein n=1 Tax=Oceaniglobus trochenteri TaxID=2763260 RepID=UPI001CFFE328|nr:ABC transporter ATP-binding protein [Oceaniglobus trochenteri]
MTNSAVQDRPRSPDTGQAPLLRLEGLTLGAGGNAVVEDVTLDAAAGEMVGLVGESGCGKSVTALAILRLLAEPQIRPTAGRVMLDGRDLLSLPMRDMEGVRGNDVAMIFQEPMTSLNPVLTVGDQVSEAILLHRDVSRAGAMEAAEAMLAKVGLPAPHRALGRYPHEMSGGQRQRVMIAIALACGPRLLVADEPTTALDVTVQAQILDLLDDLRRETGMAVLLITHDLGVVAQYCDRVAVMYGGRIVEQAPADALFAHPRHRYSQALLATMPASNPPGARLPAIAGLVPPPGKRPPGCAYHPRCAHPVESCAARMPPLAPATGAPDHSVRCWNPA